MTLRNSNLVRWGGGPPVGGPRRELLLLEAHKEFFLVNEATLLAADVIVDVDRNFRGLGVLVHEEEEALVLGL